MKAIKILISNEIGINHKGIAVHKVIAKHDNITTIGRFTADFNSFYWQDNRPAQQMIPHERLALCETAIMCRKENEYELDIIVHC